MLPTGIPGQPKIKVFVFEEYVVILSDFDRTPIFGSKDNYTLDFANVHTYYPVVTVVTAEKVDNRKHSFQSSASFI